MNDAGLEACRDECDGDGASFFDEEGDVGGGGGEAAGSVEVGGDETKAKDARGMIPVREGKDGRWMGSGRVDKYL